MSVALGNQCTVLLLQPTPLICTPCLYFCIKVSCTGPTGDELKGKIWRHYKKQYTIIALHWLASHFVVAMDTSERMHLIHVPNGQEYQVGNQERAATSVYWFDWFSSFSPLPFPSPPSPPPPLLPSLISQGPRCEWSRDSLQQQCLQGVGGWHWGSEGYGGDHHALLVVVM